MGGVQEQKYLN